ncbi:MAG: hypothetical protein ACE5JR_11045 [Gemmatimonadota bacterium]
MGPESTPATLARLSAASDSVPIGQILDRPLRVRVESSGGSPVSGVPVRFSILSGPGSLAAGSVQSAADGTAQTTFTGGTTIGTATVRADIPTEPQVAAIDFTMKTTGPGAVTLSAAGGNGQQAEVGSQLALPFVVRATATQGGAPVGGVRIDWSVAPGSGPGARLTASFGFTASDGTAQVLLTLGSEATEYRVRATSPGQADTVEFTATATAAPGSTVVLDSVRPLPLRPGAQATLFGTGFGALPAENEVRVEGELASVVLASATSVTFVAPGFTGQCLPARTVGVRAIVGGAQSNGLVVDLEPSGSSLALALGERRTFTGPSAVRCLQFAAAGSAREYRLAVQSASTAATAVSPMRLVVRSGPESGAVTVVTFLATEHRPLFALSGAAFASEAEARLRESAREALRSAGARPALDRSSRGPFLLSAVPPQVGDEIPVALAVDQSLAVSCTDTAALITGVVRAVGDHFAILEDRDAPSGGFTAADFAQLRDEFDDVAFAVDSFYFGEPSDIDGNQRVLVLFTPEVNLLTPPGSGTFIGGFFIPTDLADSGDAGGGGFGGDGICPTSNEAEIVYLLAPDPNGLAGDPVSRSAAMANARSVTAHEFQHLLSAEQRIFRQGGGFSDLEDVWLSEALSHLAEEVAGLRAAGLQERSNLDANAATMDVDAFNAFHLPNFARLRQYFLTPNDIQALALQDPSGFASLEMRGFAWIFTRWLGDHFGPDPPVGPLGGSGEAALFRELSSGGPSRLRGVANILRAVEQVGGGQRSWDELLGQFAIMPAVDDIGVAGVPVTSTLRTWDLRDLFRGLHENSGTAASFPEVYPLAVTERGLTSAAFDFDVRASTEKFFTLSEVSGPAFSLELLSPGGTDLPISASPQVTVVRTQ